MGKTMKIIKTAIVAGFLTLISTSAFAGNGNETTTTKSEATTYVVTRHTELVKAPVLLSSKTKIRRITRVVVEPVKAPVARDVSMTSDGRFLFKSSKAVNTKTFRPTATTAKAMPNLFRE